MSVAIHENNQRIAKNTLLLYVRMAVLVLVNLYTSRVVLRALGVSDYGVFNVVGGIIGFLGYINTLVAGGTSRFLTISLGKGNLAELKKTFSIIFFLCIISAILIVVFGESIGLWFVNNKLNVMSSRMCALNWVYQCALITCVFSVLQSPFMASVISHEKMDVYAGISIFDALLKLLVAISLEYASNDKLIFYSILLCCVSLVDMIFYHGYSIAKFPESRTLPKLHKDLLREIFSYSSWNLIGGVAGVLSNYGVNIIINIFFGTIVNAARGIAMQVNALVQQFFSNFQLASQPQIYKYYAQGNIKEMSSLINHNSKFSAYLILLIIIPIGMNISDVLKLWLGIVPDYTIGFVWLTFVYSFLCSIDAPIGMGIHAVGKMELPNSITAVANLLVFPLTYFAFYLGMSPYVGSALTCLQVLFAIAVDGLILQHYTGYSVTTFVRNVLLKVAEVTLVSLSLSILLKLILPQSIMWSLITALLSFVIVLLTVYYIGLDQSMRIQIVGMVKNKLHIYSIK